MEDSIKMRAVLVAHSEFTDQPTRRVDFTFGIGYGGDVDKEGLSIPFSQQDVHLYKQSSD